MIKFTSKGKNSYVTVLDIGTSKVCGFMAHILADNKPEILGVGFSAANGIKAGSIADLDKAAECIGSVLSQIEHQANRPVERVTVNLSSSHLKSRHLSKEIQILDGHPITESDVKNLVDSIVAAVPGEEEVIHAFPLNYIVDQEQNIADPRGLYANTLKAHVHVVTILETQLRNLVTVLDRCHVEIDRKVATPYATALAILSDEEKEIGATAIDMGAGTTSFALFMNGGLVHLGMVPQGGVTITRDIARVLSTSRGTAERLKTLNGAAFLSPRDELERLIVPMIAEENETNVQIPRAELIKIIVPRVGGILEGLAEKLTEHEAFMIGARRLVVAGGTSELQGIKEKVEEVLSANTRLFKLNQIKNLPNRFDSYTFVTCIGLLKYVLSSWDKKPIEHFDEQIQQKSRFGRILQWLLK